MAYVSRVVAMVSPKLVRIEHVDRTRAFVKALIAPWLTSYAVVTMVQSPTTYGQHCVATIEIVVKEYRTCRAHLLCTILEIAN